MIMIEAICPLPPHRLVIQTVVLHSLFPDLTLWHYMTGIRHRQGCLMDNKKDSVTMVLHRGGNWKDPA